MSAVAVENLYLSQIVPSTTNPRKNFDPVALEQLAESIKEIGVTVPVLVRLTQAETEDGFSLYELVSGHRRLKAAAIADLETIPAMIRELSDAEALDIQMVENLQRADLHPMDEAAGYQALIAAAAERDVALTQEELAHKVGKPLSYVAQRVKLLDLAEVPRKVFQEGHINLGHALLLSKLTPATQADGLRKIFDPQNAFGKVKDLAQVVEKSIERVKGGNERYRSEPASPVSSLKNWIKYEVELNLADAPWDLAAENLHPTATSCNLCPKRTGNNPALFSEMTASGDVCMDPACFEVKSKTFIHITVTGPTLGGKPMLRLSNNWGHEKLTGEEKAYKQGQYVVAPQGSCKDAREGVMIAGHDTGKILWVCINQACKTHKHTVDQPRETAATTASGHTVPKGMSKADYEAQVKLDKDREQAETTAIYQAIRTKAKQGSRDALLVNYVLLSLDEETCTDMDTVLELNGWMTPELKNRWNKQVELIDEKLRELKATAFNALIFDLSYGDLSDAECYREDISKVVGDLMKTYGVDEKAVIAQVKAKHPELYPEAKPKEEKAAKAAKPAAKKATKKGAKSKPTELSAEGKQRVADAIKRAVAARAKPTGKAAAAHDVDDDDLPDFDEPDEDEDLNDEEDDRYLNEEEEEE